MVFKINKTQSHTYIYSGIGILAIIMLFVMILSGRESDIHEQDSNHKDHVVIDSSNDPDLFFSYTEERAEEISTVREENQAIEKLARASLEKPLVNMTDSQISESQLSDVKADLFVDREIIEIGKGDTIAGLLNDSGIDRGRAYNAVEAMKAVYDPRDFRIGQKITLLYDQKDEQRHFTGMQFNPDRIRSIVVMEKFNGDFIAQEVAKELDERVVALNGTITSSLSVAGQEAGVPYSVLGRLISVYSWDIDFQRDIREGDTFEIMYETFTDENGEQLKTGDIIYANLSLSGRPIEIFRFEMSDGTIDWFKRDGVSVKRALMKTPINGARLSSGYGMRKHPVLGYNKMHKGLDFAAPTGTPIYASGNGVVEEAGWKGGYGKYVRIRHRNGLHTAYAHMNRIKVSKGQRVQQKDIIGTVGTTGRSTGPHLHYEVLINRKQVNPRRVDLPLGIKLTGSDAANFKIVMNSVDTQLADARANGIKLATIIEKRRMDENE